MTDRELPPPGTTTEMYLAAVHDRLGELLDRIPAPPQVRVLGPGEVELREPAVSGPVDGRGGSSPTPVGDSPGPDADTSRRPARPAPAKNSAAKTASPKTATPQPGRRAATSRQKRA